MEDIEIKWEDITVKEIKIKPCPDCYIPPEFYKKALELLERQINESMIHQFLKKEPPDVPFYGNGIIRVGGINNPLS